MLFNLGTISLTVMPLHQKQLYLNFSVSSFEQLKTNYLRTRQEEDIIHMLILE